MKLIAASDTRLLQPVNVVLIRALFYNEQDSLKLSLNLSVEQLPSCENESTRLLTVGKFQYFNDRPWRLHFS